MKKVKLADKMLIIGGHHQVKRHIIRHHESVDADCYYNFKLITKVNYCRFIFLARGSKIELQKVKRLTFIYKNNKTLKNQKQIKIMKLKNIYLS